MPAFVDLPDSLKDLAAGSSKPKKIVDIKEIRAKHERDAQGDV